MAVQEAAPSKKLRGTRQERELGITRGRGAPEDFDAAALADAIDYDEEPGPEALRLKNRVLLGAGPIYFERQVLSQCYKHATNNLLEGPVLSVADLDAAGQQLNDTAMIQARGGERRQGRWYDKFDGSYSVKAVHNALSSKGYGLARMRRSQLDPQQLPAVTEGKFLVRIVYGKVDAHGSHMTHVIGVDCDRGLLFDSQGLKPLELSRRNFRAKTGPNSQYPATRIDCVHRIILPPSPKPSAAQPEYQGLS